MAITFYDLCGKDGARFSPYGWRTRMALAHKAGEGPRPMWFSIDSSEGEIHPGDAQFASMISTNLTRLSAVEMDVLTRHSGALCQARIEKYAPELIG